MSNKPVPPLPEEKSLNKQSSLNDEKYSANDSSQVTSTSYHPHITAVKQVISHAVHNTAQALKIEPKESHPEAYHQDGKSGPE